MARDLINLAALLEEQGRWSDAVALQRRAAPIMTSAESAVIRRAIRAKFSGALGNYAQALYHANANEAGNFAEAFEAAQWAQQNEAADALSAMSARFAASGSQLAKLVRDQQDLIAERERAYKTLDAAAGKADAKGAEAARAAITAIETKLAAAEERLGREFPDFAALTSPKPLGLQETQALLGDGEALVLFLDRMPVGQLPEETIVFSLTNKESRWISMPSGRHVFQDRVAALRCGLDRTAWRVEEQGRTLPGKAAETSQQKCMRLLNTNATEDQTLPFDAAAAHALYRDLFGGIEDIIKDKALIVVTSGPLTQLPFEVLVTRLENEGASGLRQKDVAALGIDLKDLPAEEREALKLPADRGIRIIGVKAGSGAEAVELKAGDILLAMDSQSFGQVGTFVEAVRARTPGSKAQLTLLRQGAEQTVTATLGTTTISEWIPRFLAEGEGAEIAWLGQRQSITMLPSVASLKALHTAKTSAAPEPFLGFGNPLLEGARGGDRSAWAKQNCRMSVAPEGLHVASRTAGLASVVRDEQSSVEFLRRQPPLPETADELCTVAQTLGVPEGGLDDAVYLGSRASVSQVKALSASGALSRARVVHFATHGLLAGEAALFSKRAEPALLLTPPARPSEADNGLLTASEVAQLNLNADWVVMSACNTAAGSSDGAQALSGLARAFFYAGARSLLVSHWGVDSEAAVAITTGAVNAMSADPTIGRAEALRRSIAALIAKGGRFSHPSAWAPFVLVGNGGQ